MKAQPPSARETSTPSQSALPVRVCDSMFEVYLEFGIWSLDVEGTPHFQN
jgi:hypothetical protein